MVRRIREVVAHRMPALRAAVDGDSPSAPVVAVSDVVAEFFLGFVELQMDGAGRDTSLALAKLMFEQSLDLISEARGLQAVLPREPAMLSEATH